MRLAVAILVALVAFLLVGAIPVEDGAQIVVFHTPAFIALAAALALSLVRCAFGRRWRWRRAGFPAVHLGVVAILAGALAGHLAGKRGDMVLPLTDKHVTDRIERPGGPPAALGFGVSAIQFDVAWYDPVYGLYEPAPDGGRHRLTRSVPVGPDGSLDLGPLGRVAGADLRDKATGAWAPQYRLAGGAVLALLPRTPRYYAATLRFTAGGGKSELRPLAVNHPAVFRGWRFYLVDFDKEERRYIVVTARRDPGRPAVIAGIWLVIAGTALLCFLGRGGGDAQA